MGCCDLLPGEGITTGDTTKNFTFCDGRSFIKIVMESLISDVEGFLPESITGKLTSSHGKDVKILLESYKKFKEDEINVKDLLFDSKFVMDRTWEMLNIGKWSDVPVHFRQVYAISSLIHVIALLHENKEDSLKKALEITDMGLLLGSPFEEICLTKVAEILSSHMPASEIPVRQGERNHVEVSCKRIKLNNEVDTSSRPSLEFFYKNYFTKREPVKLTDCINHWPALKLWPDLNYIKSKAGHRTVPIEIGKHYADSSHRQRLMKISDFIDEYFAEGAKDVGYLAQHQLFLQIPELKKDFMEPEYCALSEKEEGASETDVNAWFGPAGTVSPLHFDAKHNLLCQAVGSKKIILFPESDTEFLYPLEGMLSNTSGVDVENPDYDAFPKFESACAKECLLEPGQILYIPPKYWHHVRALDNSFSVNFWWE